MIEVKHITCTITCTSLSTIDELDRSSTIGELRKVMDFLTSGKPEIVKAGRENSHWPHTGVRAPLSGRGPDTSEHAVCENCHALQEQQ